MLTHLSDSGAQMIDPDGRIREDQREFARRRGMRLSSGIAPPNAASLRALSRSMRALRASRSKAVFSATPVNSWAMRTRSSSRAMVVLINVPQAHIIASDDVCFNANINLCRQAGPNQGVIATRVREGTALENTTSGSAHLYRTCCLCALYSGVTCTWT